MKINPELVKHIGKLAHLDLSESEQELFARQLQNIIQYIEKLNEVKQPTDPFSFGNFLEPMVHPDHTIPSLPVEEALKNAPERVRNFFKVPRIIP
jgi:aspartyl-tRNA(Asn)/glutamyl-tRNA(Gln) amidotransferase subunit C